MADLRLAARPRQETGGGPNRRLRREGRIPAVVLGPGRQSMPVSVDAKQLAQALAQGGRTRLIDLEVPGSPRPMTVLVKEVQEDPILGDVVHVDFQRVAMDREITAAVPVVLVGEDERDKDGGILTLITRTLDVSCLPARLPAQIEVDVSRLGLGETLLVEQIDPGPGVTILTPANTAVVSVVAPAKAEPETAPEEAVPEEAAEGAEAAAGDEETGA